MNEYYLTGEFGYLNNEALPFLERYNGIMLKIYTFPDYCYIINNLFPNKFDLCEIPLHKIRLCSSSIETKNDKPLLQHLIRFYNFNKHGCYITKQITSNYNEDIDNFICYFPRYRTSDNIITNFAQRNANTTQCTKVISTFNKKYKIIIVGRELFDFDFMSYNNVSLSDSLEKTIFYLKNCNFFVSNDSGMIEFAKNCGTKQILILQTVVDYHLYWNPFNTTTININDLSDLKNF